MSYLLDEDNAAFIQSGLSISIASRDANNMPSVAKALACRVSPDRRRVTVYASTTKAAQVLRDIETSGVLAAIFTRPSTHRALQLKGRDPVIEPIRPEEAAHVDTDVGGFVADIVSIGYTEDEGRAYVGYRQGDTVAIRFTPTAGVVQTPGPRAGARLEPAQQP
ncbi:MAG: hypothetical protein N3D71_00050 [Burkholderiaceae bacterium]|nr:hypothetical protein [Burkholderiaceae bacterium]